MDTKLETKNETPQLNLNKITRIKASENDKLSTEEDSVSSTENLPQTVVEVDVHENADDANFILNKFLYESNQLSGLYKTSKSKKPVPTPRNLKTVRQSSSESNRTYDIENDALDKHTDSSISTDKEISKPTFIGEGDTNNESAVTKLLRNIEAGPTVTETKIREDSKYDYNQIVGIIIHKTDRLKLDSFVIHPLIKIHIVNMNTGEYLLKSDINRSVVFYYENKDIPYIAPTLSEPFNLFKKHTMYPEWEETILFNEDINHIVDKNTIIFFEILDFVSYSVVVSQTSSRGLSQGWHKIAWAFLRPVGKNGYKNIDEELRLQLFYPKKYRKGLPNTCPMFNWWKCKKLTKYPSTLYVTIKSLAPLEQVPHTLRSKTPVQPEAGRTCLNAEEDMCNTQTCHNSNEINATPDVETNPAWTRLQHQTCKIPNKRMTQLPSFEEGCFVLKFSFNGLYLACAVLIDALYCVVLYSVLTYKEVYRYSVHQGLIYDIIWSSNDEHIITSSADCTVSIWNVKNRNLIEMLPHPSYVYAADINGCNVIATACYDTVVRIWYPSNDDSYDLIGELEGHKGYVTSLCFSKKFDVLYSSDSVGVVIEWAKIRADAWGLKRELHWTDLKGTVINQILLHKRERRLLLHARDSTLRLIDLKTGSILKYLEGATNNKFRTTCSFSACGTFVFCGGEMGIISVWNTDLGRQVATYTPFSEFSSTRVTIHCVQFHPHDNILAISHYGHSFPILLTQYNSGTESNDCLGFRMIQIDDEVAGISRRSKNDKVKKNFSEQKFKSGKMDVIVEKMNKITINSSSYKPVQ